MVNVKYRTNGGLSNGLTQNLFITVVALILHSWYLPVRLKCGVFTMSRYSYSLLPQ
jgi:hypothetical protein